MAEVRPEHRCQAPGCDAPATWQTNMGDAYVNVCMEHKDLNWMAEEHVGEGI